MALEDDRRCTQIGYLDGKPLPSNELSPHPDNTTTSPIPHPTSTFQKDTAASLNRNRRDADMDSKGTTTASAKEALVAPRRPGGRQESARPKPSAKEFDKLVRERRISELDGAQSGPVGKDRDGKLTAVDGRGIDPASRSVVKEESPWQTYHEGYKLRIGGLVTVAVRKRAENPAVATKLVAIKTLSGPSCDAELSTLRDVQGKHFVKFVEAYGLEGDLYIVIEHMPISLVQIVAATVQMREIDVAAIIAQVVSGVRFLESRSLVHGSIDCSTVLVNDRGQVKIGMQERCTADSRANHNRADVEAVADIMIQLMEKHRKSEGPIDASKLHRWSSEAKDFVLKTASQSAAQLSKHAFLGAWSKDDLLMIVSLAQASALPSNKPVPRAPFLLHILSRVLFILSHLAFVFMEITQIYAIAAGGALLLLMTINALSSFKHGLQSLNLVRSKYLTYPLVVHRHRFVGPWSPADIILQTLYISLNGLCLFFRVETLKEAGNRAGTLSMINMAPLFFGLQLSFLADLFGLSLSNYRRVHRSAGMMSVALLVLHVSITVRANPTYSLRAPEHLDLIIGASSLGLLMALSLPFVRKLSYEFFLRTHQALAFLCAYVFWRHVHLKSLLARVCLYVTTGIFGFTSLLQLFALLYRNNLHRGLPPRAMIYRVGGGYKIHLTVHRKLKVKAGQYINLWMPSISFWSFLQSHPFVIASCEEGDRTILELLVDPQRGFTSKLQRHAKSGSASGMEGSCLALFMGPHGASAPLGDFDRVLMVASGFGIAAHLPYLRHLIRGYNGFSSRTRRIHLLWQLEHIEDGAPAQEFLNRALKEDALDDSYILRISIYYACGHIEHGSFNEGQHQRVSAYKGLVSMEDVLRAEVLGSFQSDTAREASRPGTGRYQERHEDTETLIDGKPSLAKPYLASEGEASEMPIEWNGSEMLVMVSGSQRMRDDLRRLVRGHLDQRVKLLEMDYQPSG